MDVTDELAIRNLIALVARVTDQWRTPEQLAALYIEDCLWHLEGMEPYVGRAGIIRRAIEMRDAGICGPGSMTRHIVSTPEVVVICPPLSGPETMIVWTMKGALNAEQEAQAGRDHRQAA
jgi:hypothetical protein